ncbi:NAD-dependent epimerase/dehydratase family protein [Acidiplasma aeolicum]|jgi:nucleoside-diphosphate-sugar epimerase|uniref:NAD-dependent epimerase/dehydratase family protein n=1 Tax=Acidiplasma aeolicum TaxID=507754 RepID=UPI003716F386
MKRILIAGGAGFLGSYLTEKLVGNYEVVVVDNLNSGLESNLKGVIKDIEFIKSDIETLKYEKKLDIIIDLASRASRVEWETYPVEVALSNSMGTNNLIKIALKNDALFIYASSSEVYGNADIVPTPESYVGKVDTISSRSPYDEGKRFSEALVKSYEKEYNLKDIIIRFFNTYGPRMRGGDFYGRVIDRFILQAIKNEPITVYGDGTQTRSFTYVSDTVDAINLLIERSHLGEVYNIGNDVETKIIDIAKIIKEKSGSSSEIVYKKLPENDPLRRAADISKMKKLGWKHKVSLKDGLGKTIKFYIS